MPISFLVSRFSVLSTTMDAFALGRFRQSCSSSQSSDLPENLCKVTQNAGLEDLLASTYGQFRSTKQAKANPHRTFVKAVVFLLFKSAHARYSLIRSLGALSDNCEVQWWLRSTRHKYTWKALVKRGPVPLHNGDPITL